MEKFEYELDPTCTDLECAPVEADDDKEWGPYKYLGPGTAVYTKVSGGVQPVNKLDEAAMEHDIDYWNISKAYEAGDISEAEAYRRTEAADWKLANSSFVDIGRRGVNLLPDIVKSIGGANPIGVVVSALKGLPSTLTSSSMRLKWLLSKLRLWRGGFVNLKRKYTAAEKFDQLYNEFVRVKGRHMTQKELENTQNHVYAMYPVRRRWRRKTK